MITNYLPHRPIQRSTWFSDRHHHLCPRPVLLEKMKVIPAVPMFPIINCRSKPPSLLPINSSKNIVSTSFEHGNPFRPVMISPNARVHRAFHPMFHLYDFSLFSLVFCCVCSPHLLSLEMIRKKTRESIRSILKVDVSAHDAITHEIVSFHLNR